VDLRSTCVVELTLEDVLGLEWGSRGKHKQIKEKFMGVFAVLVGHCLSERATLQRLSYFVRLLSRRLPTGGTSAERESVRDELRSVAVALSCYRMSMASDDCGGSMEMREFFSEIRRVHDVGLLKTELGNVLRDVLALIEVDREDERRLKKRREELFEQQRKRLEGRKIRISSSQRRHFEILVYCVSVFAAPFIVVGSCFGMNNNDVPVHVPWGYVLLGCGVTSVVLSLFVVVNFCRGRPALESLREERRRLRERGS
jgi:hypothetical protein